MIAFPNAKINLGLFVLDKRDDGFHNIETIFYPVPLCDVLEITENKKRTGETAKCALLIEGLEVQGSPEDNLVSKAYHRLDVLYDLPPVNCCLYKNIPMGAGLGGGSSDAASMLALLNRMYKLGLSSEELQGHASALGSDCAFFVMNKPAYVLGKGHELEPVNIHALKGTYLVMLDTHLHSDTGRAYAAVEKRGPFNDKHALRSRIALPLHDWQKHVSNDFEKPVFLQFPELGKVKEVLYACGASYASMTGSGAAMYGIFRDRPELPEVLGRMICYEGYLD